MGEFGKAKYREIDEMEETKGEFGKVKDRGIRKGER